MSNICFDDKALRKRAIETFLLSIILLAAAFIVIIPTTLPAYALTEGNLVITQDGTAKLAKKASGFSKGNHDLSIEISSDYSYNGEKVTLDPDSFSGTLTVDDDDEFDIKSLKITVAKDLKSVTYNGKLDGTSGSVSGTLKFGTAIDFENSGDNDAAANVNSMKATVIKASFDTKKTSTGNVEVDTSRGFESIDDPSFSSELPLLLSDTEMNLDSGEADTIVGSVLVEIDSVGGDLETLDMVETGGNTGQFLPDLSDDELRVTFLVDGDSPEENNGVLELRAIDIGEDIIATYEVDGDAIDQMTLGLAITPGTLSLPTYAGIDEFIVLTLNDPDLNDNAGAIDSYSFTLQGDLGVYPLVRAEEEIGDLASVAIEINGKGPDFADELTITLLETDDNTGIFEAEIDMFELASKLLDIDILPEDEIKFTYIDGMDETTSVATSTAVEMLSFLILQDGEAYLKKATGDFAQGYYFIFLEIEADYVYSETVDIQEDSIVAILDVEGDEDSFSYDVTITSLTIANTLSSISYSGYIDGNANDKIQGTLKFESPLDFSGETPYESALEEKNTLKLNIGSAKFDTKKTSFADIEFG